MKLLSTNTKLEKVPGSETSYLVRGLSLAPHLQSGRNTCPWAGACAAVCVLWFAGRTVMANVRDAMIRRTRLFFDDREAFSAQLVREVSALVRSAAKAGAVPVVRLNVASDIVWERILPQLFDLFPGVKWYDYTKAPFSARRELPQNYSLTHSVHERSRFDDLTAALDAGRNLAVVFDASYNPSRGRFGKLPGLALLRSADGRTRAVEVVDGDRHDVRIPDLDGRGVIIGLRGKGGRRNVAAAVAAGFAHEAGDCGRQLCDGFEIATDAAAVVQFRG